MRRQASVMISLRALAVLTALALVIPVAAREAAAAEPTTQLRAQIDRVLKVL
jgi:hypothetical protein